MSTRGVRSSKSKASNSFGTKRPGFSLVKNALYNNQTDFESEFHQLQQLVHTRYTLDTHVEDYDSLGRPTRCYYIEPSEELDRERDTCCLVDYIEGLDQNDFRLRDFQCVPHEYQCEYQHLSTDSKTQLYILLGEMLQVGERIYFDPLEMQWCEGETEDKPASEIDFYGISDENEKISKNRVDYILREGRSDKQLKIDVMSQYKYLRSYPTLPSRFVQAFTSKMTSGITYGALNELFLRIISIIQPETERRTVGVYVASSPTKDDLLSMSESSGSLKSCNTSRSSERRCSSAHRSLPLGKRSSPSSPLSGSTPRKRLATRQEQSSHSPAESLTHSRAVKHSNDFEVLCDEANVGGRYIALVVLESLGKSQSSFIKELLFCLQGQSEVFGLFISHEKAYLYRMWKIQASKPIIRCTYKVYMFRLPDPQAITCEPLNVSRLQEFCLDIFTCLVHGIKKKCTLLP